MKKEGTVMKVLGDYAEVKIVRDSACGADCSSCKAACRNSSHIVRAKNLVNAKKGDLVMIEMPDEKIFNAAFLVYILPVIDMIVGYFIAGIFIKSDIICALTGFIFMIISFFALHIYDKKVHEKYDPCAVSLLNEQLNDKNI